jgi:hypothetical protein
MLRIEKTVKSLKLTEEHRHQKKPALPRGVTIVFLKKQLLV